MESKNKRDKRLKMNREEAKTVMSKLIDVFRKEYPNGGAFAAIHATGGHSLINKIYDAHEAELKTKDEHIAELKAGAKNSAKIYAKQLAAKDKEITERQVMLQNMCAECECAKFADNAIKPSEMWRLHTMLKDNK